MGRLGFHQILLHLRAIKKYVDREVLVMAIPVVEFPREGYKIKKGFCLEINCSQMYWGGVIMCQNVL